MQLGPAALALPAGAAATLLLARGAAVLDGPAAAPFAALAATGVAGVIALLVAAIRRATRAREALPAAARTFAECVSGALGDAVAVLDGEGRVVQLNAALARLAGVPADDLLGRAVDVLGEDLAVLRRGLARGPAAAPIRIATPRGLVPARAALVRVGSRPVLDVVVVRRDPDAPARPPPLPRRAPAGAGASLDWPAIAAALREPLARAATAASMLRLVLPSPPARVEQEIGRFEAEVATAERRLSALVAASERGRARPRPTDLAAVVQDLLGGLPLPVNVRVRRAVDPALALAEEARLRPALRDLLRTAVAAMPQGGELAVAVARRGAEAVIELADSGAPRAAGELSVARALVAAQGGRLEVDAVPGRGQRCRVVLPSALRPARAPADAPQRAGDPFDAPAADR